MAYHHDAVVDIIKGASALVSHHASACISLRLDDIQPDGLMIYSLWRDMLVKADDIHAFGVIR